jgi:hypothetical protein
MPGSKKNGDSSNDYLATAGIQGSGRCGGECKTATPQKSWQNMEKVISNSLIVEAHFDKTEQTQPDFYQKRVAAQILCGEELSFNHLQVILAVLLGETDYQVLAGLLKGFTTKYDIPKNIKGYKPILKGERPKGERTRYRDTKIALDFEELRKTLGSNEAYAQLSEDSLYRYAITLSIDRVKNCVTKGRKYIEEDKIRMPLIMDITNNM